MTVTSSTNHNFIETEDPFVIIERQTKDFKIYRNIKDSRDKWVIYGECNCCGECEVGSNNHNIVWTGTRIGEPNAEYDTTYNTRKDIPVRPEISRCNHCTLRGEYL